MSRDPFAGVPEQSGNRAVNDLVPLRTSSRQAKTQGQRAVSEAESNKEYFPDVYVRSESLAIERDFPPSMLPPPEVHDKHVGPRVSEQAPVPKTVLNTDDSATMQYQGREIWPSRFGHPDKIPEGINECFPDSGEHWFLTVREADASHPMYGQKFSLYGGPAFLKPSEGWSGDERKDFLTAIWELRGHKEVSVLKDQKIVKDFEVFETTKSAARWWQKHLEYKKMHRWASTHTLQGTEMRNRTSLPIGEDLDLRETFVRNALIANLANYSLEPRGAVEQTQATAQGKLSQSLRAASDLEAIETVSSDEVYDEDGDEEEHDELYEDTPSASPRRIAIRTQGRNTPSPPIPPERQQPAIDPVSFRPSKPSRLQRLKKSLSPRKKKCKQPKAGEAAAQRPPPPSEWIGQGRRRSSVTQ